MAGFYVQILTDYVGFSRLQRDDPGVDREFTGMFEIDRQAIAQRGLYLTQSPIGALGIANEDSGCEWRIYAHKLAAICRRFKPV